MRRVWLLSLISLMIFSTVSYSDEGTDFQKRSALMRIESMAFNEGEPIPPQYTCDGKDMSPPLKWEGVPEGAKSLALIADDPDAPGMTWVHWVLYNIPPETKGLEEDIEKGEELKNGTRQGLTDFNRVGYGGPCPPSGTHRYFFKLYALGAKLTLKPGATKKELLKSMEDHLLAEASVMGVYSRAK